jgi:CRISPR-associated endoribonuclease Cas6
MVQRQSTAHKPSLTWKGQPDLVGIQIILRPVEDCQLPKNYTYWLHAWFLDQIRTINPNISAYLHDNQTEKAFSLSSFLDRNNEHSLTFSTEATYHCHITALCAPVCQALKQLTASIKTSPQLIHFPDQSQFQILEQQIALPPTTYENLWDQAQRSSDLKLTFLTPTSFRKNGNPMPLPIPENLFQSYLRRWNTFAHLEFDQDEFLTWVNECVVLFRHDLRSQKAHPGKSGFITGFVGTVEFGLTAKAQQEPEYIQLIHALTHAAPYTGTGYKTTFGLGQTRLGWMPSVRAAATPRSLPSAPPPAPINVIQSRKTLIKSRITELEQQFIQARKRQGGDRAKNVAHLWATIIARQESGDSLKAIAADMKLPYETVKKYAQLARKQL